MTEGLEGNDDRDHASKGKGLAWFALAGVIGLGFAFGFSPLVRAVPWSWEQKLGSTISLTTDAHVCHGNAAQKALLQKLVGRIYPVMPDDHDFSIDVQVIRENQINAFAELGGKISINSGLLTSAHTPEEVAGVLAHEIEHVRHRHILQGFLVHLMTAQGLNYIFGSDGGSDAEWTGYFLNMDFSRTQEHQADVEGLRRLQKAHVDNTGFKSFFERIQDESDAPTFLSDHPSSASRADLVNDFDNNDPKPIMSADDWKNLASICPK